MRPSEAYVEKIPAFILLILAVVVPTVLLFEFTPQLNPTCIVPLGATAQSPAPEGQWAGRFTVAAIVDAVLAGALTAYLLLRSVFGNPSASQVVAVGGAGNWLIVGYFGFIVLGVLGTLAMATFYRHIEVDLARPYAGLTNLLAWSNLVMLNAGVVGSTFLMMHAGYRGGVAQLPPNLGGKGATPRQLHDLLNGYPPYIAAFMTVALLGLFLGCLGFAMAYMGFPNPAAVCP